jgi:hypothetical protein
MTSERHRWRLLGSTLLLTCLWLSGCGVTPQLVGARWGDASTAVAARLGLSCETWAPWRGSSELETCSGDRRTPIHALGGTADVTLIRLGGRLEGVVLSFPECSAQREALTVAVRRELGAAAGDGGDPYEIKLDDSLFHFDRSDCTLTLAAPRFGKKFAAALLGEGLAGLFRMR